VPFLARELLALLWDDERTIEHIIQEILTTIQLHEIRSHFLLRKLNEYLGRYTKHFIHEFYTFARCPYDLAGFDRHAQYPTMNSSSQVIPPMQISLDNDEGDEQTPIILDETSDGSIHIVRVF
jgi:E3 ubiquitin-protein ligase Topors